MVAKAKPVPHRLGPPPQLRNIPMIQQRKFEPKMREVLARQAKMIARWIHVNLSWKKILMSWMIVLITSKMTLLMLTYEYFSLMALISLQIFHGVWTIAFFCLNILETKAILPNASCLLAGYLPATTVLHILLVPNDYPLEYIIVDAVGTFLAIITMFLLLRMECSEILHEAEELWQSQYAHSESCDTVSTTSSSELNPPSRVPQEGRGPTVGVGGGFGPTVITLDSMGFSSIGGPRSEIPSAYEGSFDLEPIDFEHFVDEPDFNSGENTFRANSTSPAWSHSK